MSEVKRWTVGLSMFDTLVQEENTKGDWVGYDDHVADKAAALAAKDAEIAALKARAEAAEKEAALWQNAYRNAVEVSRGLEAALRERAEQAEAERDRLAGVVERLPKTADGVPVVPGQLIWPTADYWIDGDDDGTPLKYRLYVVDHDGSVLTEEDELSVSKCYSTRAAAEAAKGVGKA